MCGEKEKTKTQFTMEENKKVLNLVFSNFIDEENQMVYPNCHDLYSRPMLEGTMLIKHFIDESTIQNKFTYKKYKLDDVYNNLNEKFYYLIGHGPYRMIELLCNNDPLYDDVKKCLKECSNFNIMFITEHEPDEEEGFVNLINYIKINELKDNQFYVINNNAKVHEFPKKFESKINVHDIEFLPSSSTIVLTHVGCCPFIPEKTGKFFMCFNKSSKQHRLSLLVLLKNNYILDDTNWSYIPPGFCSPKGHFYRPFFNDDELEIYKNEIDYIYNLTIKKSDYEKDDERFSEFKEVDLDGLPFFMRSVPVYAYNYENSYVNIVTESHFLDLENVVHITEKTFKPFFFYQFALYAASQHHVKTMRERYDFDFFDDIINHSYDDEPNQKIRLYKLVNEIKRLNQKKEELKEFYKYNYDRFESNKQKVLKILESNKDYEFFLNLI